MTITIANSTETDRQFSVTAELSGLDWEDISLSIQGDVLTIEGEKKQEKEEKDIKDLSVERYRQRL